MQPVLSPPEVGLPKESKNLFNVPSQTRRGVAAGKDPAPRSLHLGRALTPGVAAAKPAIIPLASRAAVRETEVPLPMLPITRSQRVPLQPVLLRRSTCSGNDYFCTRMNVLAVLVLHREQTSHPERRARSRTPRKHRSRWRLRS